MAFPVKSFQLTLQTNPQGGGIVRADLQVTLLNTPPGARPIDIPIGTNVSEFMAIAALLQVPGQLVYDQNTSGQFLFKMG